MGKIIEFDEQLPHMSFVGEDCEVEVIPVKLLRNISSGKVEVDALPDWLIRIIISEYVRLMGI